MVMHMRQRLHKNGQSALCQLHPRLKPDEHLFLTWFANAIEHNIDMHMDRFLPTTRSSHRLSEEFSDMREIR